MNTLPTKTNKKPARAAIIKAVIAFKPGETFRGETIYRVVKATLETEYIDKDTVLRYMRELRQEGVINYKVESRKSGVYVRA